MLAEEIGLLNRHGDHFKNRIIFPVWNYGKVVFFTGRAFPSGEPKYLHLKNSELIKKEIAFKEDLNKESCIVVESIADAIALKKAGFPACSLLGTSPGENGGGTLSGVKTKLYFLLDGDKAGQRANYDLAKKYHGYVMELSSDKDPDELHCGLGPDVFKEHISLVMKNAKFYLDTVIEREPINDVLSEISILGMESEKEIWLKKLSEKHRIGLRALKKDLAAIAEQNEQHNALEKSKQNESDPLSEFCDDEIAEAKELLNSPDILSDLVMFLDRAGYVREGRNKKLAYLACTSRRLPGKKKAISLITKGESGSGKSELIKQILKLIPSRDVKEFTFITEKALVHSKNDLSHKILCVFEREGGASSDYPLRTALSEEKLSIFTTRKNPNTGDFESVEKEIPAEGLVYIETTIEDRTEPQNANRTFEFYMDTSPEHTREILKSQAGTHCRCDEKLEEEFRVWRCLQELLEPLPVYVPYAEVLAEQFPVDKVRARRDFPRLLALIEASALVHQANRERKEIDGETFLVANETDFEIAQEIIMPILSQTYKDVSPKEENLVSIIREEYGLCDFSGHEELNFGLSNWFSPKEIHERIGVRITGNDKAARDFRAYSTLRNYIRNLSSEEEGILEWNGKKGAASRYALINDIQKNSLSFSLSSIANPLGNDNSTNDNSELTQEPLAKVGDSSYLANAPYYPKGEDNRIEDWLIRSPLAKSGFSQCFSLETLNYLPISSLAEVNTKEKKPGSFEKYPWE